MSVLTGSFNTGDHSVTEAARRRRYGPIYSRNVRAVVARGLMATKSSNWMVMVSGFFEPVLYLISMGVGLGAIVGSVQGPGGQEISYAAYIAPALLAVSAMNGAVYDSTWNVFFKMNFAKLYQGMLYTSLGPLDVAMGEIFLALLRGAMYATGFTAVMGVMGLITTPWAILMIPASVLIAFGFASFGMGITSYMKTFQQMDWINFVMLPMFLFSATFYPLSHASLARRGTAAPDQRGSVHPGHRRAHRLLPRHDCPRRPAHHEPAAQAVPQVVVLRQEENP